MTVRVVNGLNMLTIRSLVVAGVLAVCTSAFADFDGPTPLAWRWQQSSTVPPSGSPLVNGNVIYQGLGSRVYAIDRASGNQVWRFPKNEAIEGFVKGSPIAFDDVLTIAADNKNVYGLDKGNGSLKWIYTAPYAIIGQPVAVGKYLVIRMEGDNLMSIDTATGTAAWENPYRFLDRIGGPLHSDGSSIIFFDQRNFLVSINVVTKQSNWRQSFAVPPSDGSITVVGSNAFLYSGTYLVNLSLTNGKPKWQQRLDNQMSLSPVAGGENILCVSQQGLAYFYDQQQGRLVNRKPIDLKSSLAVRPASVGKKFIVATSNGAVNFIDPDKADVLWQYFVRPIVGQEQAAPSNNPGGAGGGFGGGGFGGGAGGGFGGGARGGGAGGFGGGAASSATNTIIAVQASNTPVFAGDTLLVPALDGSLLAFDKQLGVDLTPPTVKQVWPRMGEEISGLGSQEFLFRVEDDGSGVNASSIKVEFDGVPYDYTFGRDGFLSIDIKTTGKNKPLADGRRQLRITVADWLGNEQVTTISLRIDNTLKIVPRGGEQNRPGGFPGGGGSGKGGGPGGG